MRYVIAITDLHRALLRGMGSADEGDRVDVVVARTSEMTSPGRFAPVFRALVCCLWDRESVAVISHPFNPWFALYAFVARSIEIYDDGTAYYAESSTPSGLPVLVYKLLTAKHFRWRIDRTPVRDFGTMLAASKAKVMHAMYPQFLRPLPMPVRGIDLTIAFQEGVKIATPYATVYLDTHPSRVGTAEAATKVIECLRVAARAEPTGTIYYKPHPTGPSSVATALASMSWARLLPGPFEEALQHTAINRVYSFSSSGALSVKNTYPEARIFNFATAKTIAAPDLLTLFFRRLGAHEIEI